MASVITSKKDKKIKEKMKPKDWVKFAALCVLTVVFLFPIGAIVMNSFKGRLFISDQPFSFPTAETFSGISNYLSGIEKTGFFKAFGFSLFITVFSVAVIVLCTSMCAWFIVRVKAWYTRLLYLLCAFSMIVPFQMVMFTMTQVANRLKLDNPVGIILIYLGFGAGLSVFMFTGFIKGVPLEIEEAAMIDGCTTMRTYFSIVLPIIKPTAITVAILNAMWIWNDYLLPKLLLESKYYTIPIVLQNLVGSRGMVDMGAMMATIILAIIPIIVFYLACQKHIIKGVVAGAVKG
ncbi:ABC transporter permease [Clostridia bacterium]|nr:ABC transporter permease [Clostridia bacterium]